MSEEGRGPAAHVPGFAEEAESEVRVKSVPPEAHLTWREVEAYLATGAGAARVQEHAARHPGVAYLLDLLSREDEIE